MKKKIGDFTINELLHCLKYKCKEIGCDLCPLRFASCGSIENDLDKLIEDVGKDTLIEVEDE